MAAVRRRSSKDSSPSSAHQIIHDPKLKPFPSDALPLPLYLTNAFFFTLFFSVVYYLLLRWRQKIRNSIPLHVVTLPEMFAIATFFASFIYLLGFFGIGFVHSLIIPRSSHDDILDEDDEDEDEDVDVHNNDFSKAMLKEDSPAAPCCILPQSQSHDDGCNKMMASSNKIVIPAQLPPQAQALVVSDEDEEIVKSVLDGKTPSYALESKLGDCFRAAAIRREALQRATGKSLAGLPLEGFNYDAILGQCCEMPV